MKYFKTQTLNTQTGKNTIHLLPSSIKAALAVHRGLTAIPTSKQHDSSYSTHQKNPPKPFQTNIKSYLLPAGLLD